MKIHVLVTVDVDPARWMEAMNYSAATTEEIGQSVRAHIKRSILQSTVVTNSGATISAYRPERFGQGESKVET